MLKINAMGNLSTVTIGIDGVSYRALIDTGAETSIMDRRVFNSIKNKPAFEDRQINLQTAHGTYLKVD